MDMATAIGNSLAQIISTNDGGALRSAIERIVDDRKSEPLGTANVDNRKIADHIVNTVGIDEIARAIDVTDIAGELDMSDVAREVAALIDAEDVASEMDLVDVARELDVDEIARAIVDNDATLAALARHIVKALQA